MSVSVCVCVCVCVQIADLRNQLGGAAGKLVLLEPIGQGGYGLVYRGEDTHTHTHTHMTLDGPTWRRAVQEHVCVTHHTPNTHAHVPAYI